MDLVEKRRQPWVPVPAVELVGLRAVGRLLLRQPRGLAWIVPLAWALLIWQLSGREAGRSIDPDPLFTFIWNIAHAPEFGLLALFLVPLVPRREGWAVLGRSQILTVASVAGLYAVVDELHQGSTRGRDCSTFDVVTDLVGIVSVLVVVRYVSSPAASARGLRWRLAAGFAACLGAAGLSTIDTLARHVS